MNKKVTAILIGIILLAAAYAGFVLFQYQNSMSAGNDDQIENTSNADDKDNTSAEDGDFDTATSSEQENTTESDKNDGKNPQNTTSNNKKEEPAKPISLPYTIPGTTLVLSKIDSYDGIFLEDGSDKEVTGITTIILENKGSKGIEYADVTVNQKGKELKFKATDVPAGKTIVVQELNGTAYNKSDIYGCTAQVAELDEFEMSETMVEVKELENGSLEVKNLTDKKIPAVRVFYKFALEKGELYVGGITYTAKVTDLEPSDVRVITPSHYIAGSSEIMMVRVYDTAE